MSLAIAINKQVSCQTAEEKEERLQQRQMRCMERISRRNAEETPEDSEVRLHDRRFRYREIERHRKGSPPQWNYI